MAQAPSNGSGLPHIWLPALLISFVVSILCAATLYYLLAQQDRSQVAQRNAAAVETVERSGRAMARTFAWFSESLLSDRLANVQQALEGQAPPAGLIDAAVITTDNLVVASRNPAGIGRHLLDPGWIAARKSQAGSVSSGIERGRQVLIVTEPLRQQERIIGWIRLVFSVPQDVATTRSNWALAGEVTLAVAPLFVLMATLLILTLRVIMSQVRSLIGRILLEAMDEPQAPMEGSTELFKAG
jgi:hypothetical protein